MDPTEPTPQAFLVRILRDLVYGPCSDASWEAVKENWMRPDAREWLRVKAAQPLPDRSHS